MLKHKTNKLTNTVKGEAYRIVYGQLAMVIALAFLAFIFRGILYGLAVLSGGLAYVLPNIVFVWRVFNHVSVRQIEKFMAAFFFGEIAKLLASAVLFILIVKYTTLSVVWMLAGYVGAIIAFWISSFICLSRKSGVAS